MRDGRLYGRTFIWLGHITQKANVASSKGGGGNMKETSKRTEQGIKKTARKLTEGKKKRGSKKSRDIKRAKKGDCLTGVAQVRGFDHKRRKPLREEGGYVIVKRPRHERGKTPNVPLRE